MPTSTVKYLGALRTECLHQKSGNTFITDAPVDNNGKGEAFSPTDTVATALGSCMLTVMGIKARDMAVDLTGAIASIEKVMASAPRRISEIKVVVDIPVKPSDKDQKILEHTARTCPVLMSIHPEIKKDITFHWG
ncbi:OsmC family peroxiredoxin [Robertkochia marina]|uniref:OsmC family peroxiredoxin n=1 Tax=Robertkochia marina TaxID=1227945 RepID=A0A4V3UXU7_9FLAO|nr:OsmC family protein [Robertkochia marina]THD65720.1 OsmC family peroxiredoxin [Robertkochia marina]TRZ46595.1 OsmC family peroxiredoxin [Robertkochia marina]